MNALKQGKQGRKRRKTKRIDSRGDCEMKAEPKGREKEEVRKEKVRTEEYMYPHESSRGETMNGRISVHRRTCGTRREGRQNIDNVKADKLRKPRKEGQIGYDCSFKASRHRRIIIEGEIEEKVEMEYYQVERVQSH